MRRPLPRLLALAASAALLTGAALAQDLKLKIPLPPVPKFEIPKPPVPKIRIEGPETDRRRDRRPSRRYDYYPERQVYFDPARSLYFFLEANRWVARAMLPPALNIRVGAPPVVVELDTDTPYDRHEEVRQMYPGPREHRRRYGYRDGFDDGYGEGYDDGYNAGFKASFDQGYSDGYRAALRDLERDRGRHRDRGRDRDREDRGRGGWEERGRN